MSEWKDLRLGDITKVITKGTTPSNIGADFTESGIKYIRSEMLKQSKHLSNDGFLYISEDTHSRLRRSQLQCNDILFSMAGAYLGKTAILRDCDVPSNTNQAVAIIRVNEAVADADFVYYYLNLPTTTKLVNSISSQSAQPNINLTQIGDLITPMPNLPTQRRIASILSSLDAKIENNNKVNAKLEEIAQNLFKEWFVDFGPFKDGKFVDSELGPIPEEWRVGTLGEIAEVIKNSINPAKHGDTLFAHYSLPAFDRAKMPELQYGDEIKSNKLVVKNDTILLSKLNPYIKRIWYVDVAEDNPICSTEFLPFRSKDGKDSAFIYSCITDETFYSKIMGGVTGATNSHQRLDVGLVLDTQIVFNKNAFERFSEKVQPMLDSICSNIRENQKLATLRDTLLPKLMSGEIEV